MVLKKAQIKKIEHIFKEKYANDLYNKFVLTYKEESAQLGLTFHMVDEWVNESIHHGIKSDDCVEDFCRIRLFCHEIFSEKKYHTIINNILLNNDIREDRKIILLEKYIYDDLMSKK